MKKLSSAFLLKMYLFALVSVLSTSALEAFSNCAKCCVCATRVKTSTFCNNNPIALPALDPEAASEPGTPNPSCIKVCGISKWAVVKGLKVTLENVQYEQANLVSAALVSPCGDCIILLNQVGEDALVFGDTSNPLNLSFSDCDGTAIPCSETGTLTGTMKVRPTDCSSGNYCFANLSSCSFSTSLSSTFCKLANGCWKLYTCVRAPGAGVALEDGSIGSWKLVIDHCIPCEKPEKCNDPCNDSCAPCNGENGNGSNSSCCPTSCSPCNSCN